MHLKTMKDRGVLLAVCSKNDERNALLPFEEHPEMVLKREDFVAFKANWQPKSDNLRAIAHELNIGLDALVFADDNPAEREEVRQALPQVFVPELTADPADYPMIVDAARCFEVSIVTEEDRQRSGMYRQQSQRSELLGDGPEPWRVPRVAGDAGDHPSVRAGVVRPHHAARQQDQSVQPDDTAIDRR